MNPITACVMFERICHLLSNARNEMTIVNFSNKIDRQPIKFQKHPFINSSSSGFHFQIYIISSDFWKIPLTKTNSRLGLTVMVYDTFMTAIFVIMSDLNGKSQACMIMYCTIMVIKCHGEADLNFLDMSLPAYEYLAK